ncbi:MAG: hypothetical protein GYB66_12875 [Chloroflexi bacterium]|nr:hypothetical protein [Chloroflexota bacterium]
MADWLEPFLAATPGMAWFFLGVGVPWALALLPRSDWHDWPMVAGLGLALGPLLGTTWLFILGTIAAFSLGAAFGGTVLIAIVGAALAWRQRLHPAAGPEAGFAEKGPPFKLLAVVLLMMMTLAMAANIWDTAFWPFLRYDTLWTFGYNPKIFMAAGEIPTSIAYYPQLVPLTFTFADLVWGTHNDHAARAAVPWFILSSAFAAYILGWRLYGRRMIGLATAAMWLLVPSILVWSSSGDLEHVVPIYFTLAAVFVVLAWRTEALDLWPVARRYAIIAGLMLAGALWTKPTAGAFVIGLLLVLIVATLYAFWRRDWHWWRHKVYVMIWVALVAVPIGGMWYMRNILAGHPWTDLPPEYWHDLAQRSGMQLNWLWFLAGLATLGITRETWQRETEQYEHRLWTIGLAMGGFAAISLAVLPTALSIPEEGWRWETTWGLLNGFREPDRRLTIRESLLLVPGTLMLIWSGRRVWMQQRVEHRQALVLSWGLGLPFFLVYFWSFSYHYRLTLTVMPLIFAPIGALLVTLGWPLVMANRLRRLATAVIIAAISLIAPVAATYHTALNSFNPTGVDTDREKYAYANPALMQLVDFLEDYPKPSPRILIPGENRLSFFFPDWHIEDTKLPTSATHLRDFDLYVPYASHLFWLTYDQAPNQVMAWTQLAWQYPLPEAGHRWAAVGPYNSPQPRLLMPVAIPFDDGKDRYEVFAIDVPATYFYLAPETKLDEVIFGGVIQLLGYDLPSRDFEPGQHLVFDLYWRGAAAGPPQQDYGIYVHLLDLSTGELLDQADGGLMQGTFGTRFLEPGMVFQDRRQWIVSPDLQPGSAVLRIGVYDVATGRRLPVVVDGQSAGDGLVIETEIMILPPD